MMCQQWDSERYARHARFVSDHGRSVVELLAPRAGECILDLGCGDGALTEALVEAGADVIGVDSSANQVEAARRRGLDARIMDARELPFEETFDAVFSNAALHWVQDLPAALARTWRSLRPGGRFVGEMGGDGNVAAVYAAVVSALAQRGIDATMAYPWVFPSLDAFRAMLKDAGFEVRSAELFARHTRLPGDIGGWLETFAESFLSLVPHGERPALIDDVRDRLEPHLRLEDGGWHVDYVRLRFHAVRSD